MASALPVVSADRGGVLENMRDGINGMVVAAGDGRRFAEAIVALIRDVRQRAAMGQAARAFAVGRDWDREISELERMYREAIANGLLAVDPMEWEAAPPTGARGRPAETMESNWPARRGAETSSAPLLGRYLGLRGSVRAITAWLVPGRDEALLARGAARVRVVAGLRGA